MKTTFRNLKLTVLTSALAWFGASTAAADESRHAGRAGVYQNIEDASLERVSTPDAILGVTSGTVASTEIWRVLEHGEKVECLSCIAPVSKLLYNGNSRTREIAAWWLRRRVFGVFGPGEVYSQTVSTLQNDENENRRAYAAEALGEFLVGAGVKHVARALATDESPVVREAAVRALVRLNDEGPNGELGAALDDAFVEVRLAALKAAANINTLSSVDRILLRFDDESPAVRRTAAEVLGTMRVGGAVAGLMMLAQQDDDPDVRKTAVAALGQIGDPVAREVVQEAESDPDLLVRSAARIALRRL